MLSREWMGVVALCVLWGNTVLVALAALKNLQQLRKYLYGGRVLAVGALTPGEHQGIFRAELPPGKAFHLVEQVGRVGAGATPSIVWHDRHAESRLLPCSARADGRAVELSGAAAVWPRPGAVGAAATCSSPAEFEQALSAAKKPRGYDRPVEVSVSGEVWIAGRVRSDEGSIVVTGGPLVVSEEDPRVIVGRKTAFVVGVFIPTIFALAAGCTWLATFPTAFDNWVSKLGGVLSLIFFLLVLPAGTRVRDFLLPPHRSFLRGAWAPPR
jgi:hypothetical protein